jgi:hypothetical protein
MNNPDFLLSLRVVSVAGFSKYYGNRLSRSIKRRIPCTALG